MTSFVAYSSEEDATAGGSQILLEPITPMYIDDLIQLMREDRAVLRESFRSNSAEKDTIVVAVSGAALAASVAFLTDLPNAGWTWLLILGLALLVASLVCVLLSLHFNEQQLARAIAGIDGWLGDPSTFPPGDAAYFIRIGRFRIRLNNLLNGASVFLLIAGLIAVITFVSLNLGEG